MANGLATPSGLQTTNLTEIGEGRRTVVSLNLDRMADSVSGQTVVDPKGYLTDLKSIKVCICAPMLACMCELTCSACMGPVRGEPWHANCRQLASLPASLVDADHDNMQHLSCNIMWPA